MRRWSHLLVMKLTYFRNEEDYHTYEPKKVKDAVQCCLGLSFAYKPWVIAISAFQEACLKFLTNSCQGLTFTRVMLRDLTIRLSRFNHTASIKGEESAEIEFSLGRLASADISAEDARARVAQRNDYYRNRVR